MSTSPPLVVADRYRLVAPLGQGGMGRVWRATDVVLHREVAIKELVPPPGLTHDERREMRERSLREARAIARLNNINVVRVFDVLRTDADPWIVMEYVPSRSLQDTLASDGPVAPVRAAEIGLGVLNALRAAHRNGVVHRDVKPGNVLLGEDGRVVLTDFGLATLPGNPDVTRTGLVLGSPAYIAPERARDGTAGPAADLWSLGATLYAAVEGQSPFARPSAIATLAALATENPPPARNAGPLKPVLNGLLRKDPAHRINAEEAERLLLRATGRRSRLTFPMSPTMRRPGVGRERHTPSIPPVVPGVSGAAPVVPGVSGAAPVVPGPRPPVSRPQVPPAASRPQDPPAVSPQVPPAETPGGRPVFAPGKASVGRAAALDQTKIENPRGTRSGAKPGTPGPDGSEAAPGPASPSTNGALAPGTRGAYGTVPAPEAVPPQGRATAPAGDKLDEPATKSPATPDAGSPAPAAGLAAPAAGLPAPAAGLPAPAAGPAAPAPGTAAPAAQATTAPETRTSTPESPADAERRLAAAADAYLAAEEARRTTVIKRPGAMPPAKTAPSPASAPDATKLQPAVDAEGKPKLQPAAGAAGATKLQPIVEADAATKLQPAVEADGETKLEPAVDTATRQEPAADATKLQPPVEADGKTPAIGVDDATKLQPAVDADGQPKRGSMAAATTAPPATDADRSKTSATEADRATTPSTDADQATTPATAAPATEAATAATATKPATAADQATTPATAGDQAAKPAVEDDPAARVQPADTDSAARSEPTTGAEAKAGQTATAAPATKPADDANPATKAAGIEKAVPASAAEPVTDAEPAAEAQATTADAEATGTKQAQEDTPGRGSGVGGPITDDDASAASTTPAKATNKPAVGARAGSKSARKKGRGRTNPTKSTPTTPAVEPTTPAKPSDTNAKLAAADVAAAIDKGTDKTGDNPVVAAKADKATTASMTAAKTADDDNMTTSDRPAETAAGTAVIGVPAARTSTSPSFAPSNRPAWQPMPAAPPIKDRGLTVFGVTLTRRQTVVAVAIVAAVLLLLGILIPLAVAGGDDKTGGQAKTAGTPSAGNVAPPPAATQKPTTTTPSEQQQQQKPSSAAPPATSKPPAAAPLPAGWTLHKDRTGFEIPLPKGFKFWKNQGTEVYFKDNTGSGRLLIVDQTKDPKPDPVADWKSLEAARRGTTYRNYQRIRIVPVSGYFQKAADWEFTYISTSGNAQHAQKRGIVVNANQAYGISFYTTPEAWSSNKTTLAAIYKGFKPV